MISLGSLEHICEEASRLVFESKSICIPNEVMDTKRGCQLADCV
jgi:hypothetical protein